MCRDIGRELHPLDVVLGALIVALQVRVLHLRRGDPLASTTRQAALDQPRLRCNAPASAPGAVVLAPCWGSLGLLSTAPADGSPERSLRW